MYSEKKKIIIVDDDEDIRNMIKRILFWEGDYIIEEAGNCDEAEEKLKEFTPDLIIIDIKMPQRPGYELCALIKERTDLKNVKIIGMSGISGEIGAAFMEVFGANYYFEKPFDAKIFHERIKKLLNETAYK